MTLMHRVLAIGGFVAAAVILLAALSPWWYSTPRYCILVLEPGFGCPQSQGLGEGSAGVEVALIAITLTFVVLLTLKLATQARVPTALLPATALAVGSLIVYSTTTKPAVDTGLGVGLDHGFYLAAAAAAMMLAVSLAMAMTTRRLDGHVAD